MFTAIVSQSPFIANRPTYGPPLTRQERIFNAYFNNILIARNDLGNMDVVLSSIIRAFIKPRLDDTQKFGLYLTNYADGETDIRSALTRCLGNVDYGLLVNSGIANINFIAAYDIAHDEDTKYPEIEQAIKAILGTSVYIRKTGNYVGVFCDDTAPFIHHIIPLFLTKLFPELFDNHPLSDSERNVLLALFHNNTADAFIEALTRLKEEFNITDQGIEEELRGLNKRLKMQRVENLKMQLDDTLQRMNNVWEDYLTYQEKYMNVNRDMEAARLAAEDNKTENDLVEYLKHNHDRIVIDDISEEGNISFWTKTTLMHYDQDEYEMCVRNDNYWCVRAFNTAIPREYRDTQPYEALRFAYDRIFGEDPKYAINILGYYSMDIIRGRVTSRSNFSADCPETERNYLPNPHLYHFHCLGDHARYIAEYLRNNDPIGAFEQCLTSTASVHFAENVTVQRLIIDLWNSPNTYLTRLSDNKKVSFLAAFTEGLHAWAEQNKPAEVEKVVKEAEEYTGTSADTITADETLTGTDTTETHEDEDTLPWPVVTGIAEAQEEAEPIPEDPTDYDADYFTADNDGDIDVGTAPFDYTEVDAATIANIAAITANV